MPLALRPLALLPALALSGCCGFFATFPSSFCGCPSEASTPAPPSRLTQEAQEAQEAAPAVGQRTSVPLPQPPFEVRGGELIAHLTEVEVGVYVVQARRKVNGHEEVLGLQEIHICAGTLPELDVAVWPRPGKEIPAGAYAALRALPEEIPCGD